MVGGPTSLQGVSHLLLLLLLLLLQAIPFAGAPAQPLPLLLGAAH